MDEIFKDYLSILKLPRRVPDLYYLNELICSHLQHIPFENISKIYFKNRYGRSDIPSFHEFIERIKKYNFGGTCYSLNYYFNQLLNYLGYDAIICGADMSSPDVHLVSLVRLNDREYIIDVGYAAPFLEPLPRDLTSEFIIQNGYDTYVLLPKDKEGRSQLNLFRNNFLAHRYIVKPQARSISEFKNTIKASFDSGASFMNSILLTKFDKYSSVIIRDLSLIEVKEKILRKRELADNKELITEIINKFCMPRELVAEVIESLKLGEVNPWTPPG